MTLITLRINRDLVYSQLSSRRRPLERALSTRPGGEFPCISHRAGILRRFGLKTGIHFPHFGLELGMVFEGTTGVCELIHRFYSK